MSSEGRAATDEERRTSPRRIAKLEEYSSLRREWQALGLPEPDSETLASGGSGGVMGVEQGALALRMAAEAHSMYLRVLMERCASLPVSDVLSALGSDLLDGATRLFSRFDADVDGLLLRQNSPICIRSSPNRRRQLRLLPRMSSKRTGASHSAARTLALSALSI